MGCESSTHLVTISTWHGRRPGRTGVRSPRKLDVGEFFSEIMVFQWFLLWGKGSYATFSIVKIRKIWEKKWKKRSLEILNMEIFSEKTVIQKSWSAKNLSVPLQTRRQVSATAAWPKFEPMSYMPVIYKRNIRYALDFFLSLSVSVCLSLSLRIKA